MSAGSAMQALLDNPIIWREGIPRVLRRANERTQIAVALGAAATGVLIAIFFVAPRPQVAQSAAAVIAWVYAALAILVTPVYCSRAIAHERALGTWDALVMTRLGGRAIVLGKLLAALLQLWVLGLIMLPMLVVMCVLSPSGTGLAVVARAYGAAVVTPISFGSLGLWCSMRCRGVVGATVATFGIIAFVSQVAPMATGMLTTVLAVPALGAVLIGGPRMSGPLAMVWLTFAGVVAVLAPEENRDSYLFQAGS